MAVKSVNVTKGIRIPIINERFLSSTLRVLASSKDMNKRSLNNIVRLLGLVDKAYYSRDLTVGALIEAVGIAIDARMDGTYDLENVSAVKDTLISRLSTAISPIYAEAKENIIIPTVLVWEAKEKDVEYVNNTIESYVKYGTIIGKKDKIADIATDLSSGNVINLKQSIQDFRSLIDDAHEQFRISDNVNAANQVVHMGDDEFHERHLRETFRKMKSPKVTLKTGLKKFNEMLSEQGGFLPKYHIFYADINSFKSGLLMYIAKWVQKYNSSAYIERFRETKKRPTVLFISLENFLQENADRFFSMYTGNNILSNSTYDDVRNIWLEEFTKTGSIIDIAMYHSDPDSLRVSDMNNMIDSLNEDGYEVIALIVDYLELIRPEDDDMRKEKRDQLTAISAKLHMLSGRRDIAVMTAQQLNREGGKVMNEARQKDQINVVKNLNRGFVGEAHGIDKSVDFSGFLALEKSRYDGKTYLTLKREKCRFKRSKQEYFVHEMRNGFFLEDDFEKDYYISKDAISPEDDSLKDTGAGTSTKVAGDRGQTNVRNVERPKMEVVIKKNWYATIDDEAVQNNFIYSLLANQSEILHPEDLSFETDEDGSFGFDNTFIDQYFQAFSMSA
jgi:hypothetical protein